jgi:hypothetical protein
MFPTVCSLAAGNKLICVIEEHLNALQQTFSDYFEKNVEDLDWVHEPFNVFATFLPLKAEEELMGLKADRTLKFKFRELSLDIFWLPVKEEYPMISEMAFRILLPFLTAYLCELGVFNTDGNKHFKEGVTKNH